MLDPVTDLEAVSERRVGLWPARQTESWTRRAGRRPTLRTVLKQPLSARSEPPKKRKSKMKIRIRKRSKSRIKSKRRTMARAETRVDV